MTGRSKYLRHAVAAVAFALLTIGSALAAQDAYFADTLRPNGQARSTAAKFADARTCGASGGHISFMPAFQKCMSAKGWVLDHYAPDRAASPRYGTVVNFIDVKGGGKGQGRANAALQSDGRSCRGAGDQDSAPFKQCMAARGWQFTVSQYNPPTPRPRREAQQNEQQGEWTWSDSSEPVTEEFDNHDGDQSRDQQAALDAVIAASQATADSINAMNQQMANDMIRANEP